MIIHPSSNLTNWKQSKIYILQYFRRNTVKKWIYILTNIWCDFSLVQQFLTSSLKVNLHSTKLSPVVNCLKLNHHDVLENIAETITEYCTTILDIIKGFCFRFLSDHTHVLFSHRFPYEHLKKNIYFKVGKLMS